MKRQSIRKFIITLSLLLFPITIYYFSPALIINAAFSGIINGSFIVFVLMLLLSIPFGRLFCGYLCPAGGLQECAFAVNGRAPRQGWRNRVKYVIWGVWLAAVTTCYLIGGGIFSVDFLFETANGISVMDIQGYIIYYGIVLLVFLPAVFGGKRIFCHYFCWMAPFMVIGTKLRRALKLPGLHIAASEADCISCGKCNKSCPMSIDVQESVRYGSISSLECIQCGACVDCCPRRVLTYKMKNKP